MKCSQCGLVNFKTATVCKRCGADVGESVNPKGESHHVWRDKGLLVTRIGGVLPHRCMKCNSSHDAEPRTTTLAYLPKYNLALLLFGFIYYKKVKTPTCLCQKHASSRGKSILVCVILMLGGVVSFVVGFADYFPVYSGSLMVAGMISFAVGAIIGTVSGSPLSIERMDKSHLWLKGVGKDYLATVPQWKQGF